MSLQLNAATSGSTTLVPTDAVTATLTLPSATGTLISTASSGQVIPSGALPAGTILQVVNASYSTEVQSSTSTFVDTGLTATITPKFSTSKILVLIGQNGLQKASSNTNIKVRLLRNGSVISSIEDGAGYNAGTGANYIGGVSANYLDSPATTSAVTYKTQTCSANNTAIISVQVNSSTSTITLMEIAS